MKEKQQLEINLKTVHSKTGKTGKKFVFFTGFFRSTDSWKLKSGIS